MSEQPDATAAPNPKPAADDEVRRLREQVAELEHQLAERPAASDVTTPIAVPQRRRLSEWWRPPVVCLLLIIATICAPAAVVARWTSHELGDTDTYVATVAPLANEPSVQAAITDQVTKAIFTRLDVQAITTQAVQALEAQGLPPNVATALTALSGPLANGVESFVHDQVAKIVASQQFQDAWVAANRAAHAQLVAVLTGDQSAAVTVQDNNVSVNLAAVIDSVKATLSAQGFSIVDRLPTVNASFVVLEGADISRAQRVFSLLDSLATAFPVVVIIALLAGVAISRHHRRTLMIGALAIAVSMLVLGAGLNLSRPYYLDALPDAIPQKAGGDIFDTITATIRTNLRAVLVLFLVIAAAAWATGASTPAVTMRQGLSRATTALREGGARHGIDAGPVGTFVGRYRTPLRLAVIGVCALVYVVKDHPTAGFTIVLAIVLLVLIGIIELLAAPVADDDVSGSMPPSAPPSTA
ncbi:hypothetical protein ACPPVT_03620 [Angustibacter sp. McL0619]|uniref:hypothetical protein n=1 Tax=Angustibacter sp. McL0619 TaxID=3415676 RepID=UPI003CF66CFA